MKTFESVNHIDKDLIKETGCTMKVKFPFLQLLAPVEKESEKNYSVLF